MVIVIYTFCHSIIKSFPFIARHAAAVSNAKDVYSNLLVQVLRVIRLGNAIGYRKENKDGNYHYLYNIFGNEKNRNSWRWRQNTLSSL